MARIRIGEEQLVKLTRKVIPDHNPVRPIIEEIVGIIGDCQCGKAQCGVELLKEIIHGLGHVLFSLEDQARAERILDHLIAHPSRN